MVDNRENNSRLKSILARSALLSIFLSTNEPVNAQTVQEIRSPRHSEQPEFVGCRLIEVGVFPAPIAGSQLFRLSITGTHLPLTFAATFTQGTTRRLTEGRFTLEGITDDEERLVSPSIALNRAEAIALLRPFTLAVTITGLGTRQCIVAGFTTTYLR